MAKLLVRPHDFDNEGFNIVAKDEFNAVLPNDLHVFRCVCVCVCTRRIRVFHRIYYCLLFVRLPRAGRIVTTNRMYLIDSFVPPLFFFFFLNF